MRNPLDQDHIRQLLKSFLNEAQKRNSRFSMRALAKQLDLSVSGLSSFMAGKLKYSTKTLEKIVYHIIKSPEERKNILAAYNEYIVSKIRDSQIIEYNHRLLKEDEISFIRDWHNYALLFLIMTEGFKFDVFWISERLEISVEEVEETIKRLSHLKLIELDGEGSLKILQYSVKTSDDKKNEAVRFMHKQMLNLASNSLDSTAIDLRDITSITLPINVNNIPKAKELIRKLQDDLMLVLTEGSRTEVYHMLCCLYPVTK